MPIIDLTRKKIPTNITVGQSCQIILREFANIITILVTPRTSHADQSPLELMVRYRF